MMNNDYAMKFEKLLCNAFQCARYGGPDNCANADYYRHRIVNNYRELVWPIKEALKTVSSEFQWDQELPNKIEQLMKEAMIIHGQEDLNNVIDKITNLFEEKNINRFR